MRFPSVAVLSAAVLAASLLAACATKPTHVQLQQPRLPADQAAAWGAEHRLYRSVALDYVGGMSQRSYLFAEANQSAFRPLLERAMDRAGLLAPTVTAARYALQIDFEHLQGSAIGYDFTSDSLAAYRIVNRATGEIVFESRVPASFKASFTPINEKDAEAAWLRSAPLLDLVSTVGPAYALNESVTLEYFANDAGARDRFGIDVIEATQDQWNTGWRRYYQANVWAALWGPVTQGLSLINPTNFIASPNFWGVPPRSEVLGARRGALDIQGFGARNGGERARQADFHMMSQSITRFMIRLGESEQVRFATVVPCLDNAEVLALKGALTANGIPWRSDNCQAYRQRKTDGGLPYTSYF
jgi:hypothetical protein